MSVFRMVEESSLLYYFVNWVRTVLEATVRILLIILVSQSKAVKTVFMKLEFGK